MAHCNCPSVAEGRVRLTTHLAGCAALEAPVSGVCYNADEDLSILAEGEDEPERDQ